MSKGHETVPFVSLEMANNHMGSVEHGLRIIREFGAVIRDFTEFRFAFKLQYRDLDTFVHPAYKGRSDIKYVKRFEETRLTDSDFQALIAEMRVQGFTPMCTPFDEASVDRIALHGIDIIKIASCALTDWPLLEKIASADKPIIASTAGSNLDDIDRVVSFFMHRDKKLSLMHCVSEYPTPSERFHLNQIDLLRERYPHIPIGYSTHEQPDSTVPIQIAIGKGAQLFEKHVGVPTPEWPLNDYSATPQQVRGWLQAAREALQYCGPSGERVTGGQKERDSLDALSRGVYVRNDVPAGKALTNDDVFFAFPPEPGQVLAQDWSKYHRFVTTAPIAALGALSAVNTEASNARQKILQTVEKVKSLLKEGHIVVPGKADLEISHHYGIDQFDQYGLVMITVINREYCKKLIAMLPGQTHPEQHHLKKEETFMILHGEINIVLDGNERTYHPGDVVVVTRGTRHMFHTENGVVFEELSSTHYKDDSFYTDAAIQDNPHRKTLLTYWM